MNNENGIKVTGVIVKKISSKGNEYYACEVPLTENYTATFFPQKAEVEVLKLNLELLQLKQAMTNVSK